VVGVETDGARGEMPANVDRVTVAHQAPADGRRINELSALPEGAWISLVVRHGELLPCTETVNCEPGANSSSLPTPRPGRNTCGNVLSSRPRPVLIRYWSLDIGPRAKPHPGHTEGLRHIGWDTVAVHVDCQARGCAGAEPDDRGRIAT
jgi:hypothetical protein